jgi:hypothetical protein
VIVAQVITAMFLVLVEYADALRFAVVANMSIASLNLSLLVNSIGFYQVLQLSTTVATAKS